MEKTDKLRLFIAVPTPDEVKEVLATAQSELRRAGPAREIRWTKPEQFHLTLKFLGNVAASRVDDLKGVIHAACESFAPLQLTARGIGFFPARGSPRVVWAGVSDSGKRLADLWKALELATRPFSGEATQENFTGHITLARVNRVPRAQADALVKAAARFEETSFGQWTAGKIDLMKSELSPQGARHTLAAAVPFGESVD